MKTRIAAPPLAFTCSNKSCPPKLGHKSLAADPCTGSSKNCNALPVCSAPLSPDRGFRNDRARSRPRGITENRLESVHSREYQHLRSSPYVRALYQLRTYFIRRVTSCREQRISNSESVDVRGRSYLKTVSVLICDCPCASKKRFQCLLSRSHPLGALNIPLLRERTCCSVPAIARSIASPDHPIDSTRNKCSRGIEARARIN